MNDESIARMLIVDDEPALVNELCHTLTVEGYGATGVGSAQGALELLQTREFDILLIDLMMPGIDAIAFMSAALAIAPDVIPILMTAPAAIEAAVEATQSGAMDYIVKPFEMTDFLPILNRAVAMRLLRVANKQLEQRVQEQTRELEAANRQLEAVNRDLESFSYSVSHDLRAPLRTVQGFCQIFMEDYAASVPPEGVRVLQRVEAGAKRMGRLIEDLLALSKLGRRQLTRTRFNIGKLAQRVASEQLAREPNREVELRIGELGDCEGDESLVEQVLVNLTANALKFARGSRPSVIEVSCHSENGETIYRVRDNGVGFNMEHAGKLFAVFQRLHSEAEFEGTGIGLTIVHRIVQRHGGRIWAESEPGKGASFYFTLRPKLAA